MKDKATKNRVEIPYKIIHDTIDKKCSNYRKVGTTYRGRRHIK